MAEIDIYIMKSERLEKEVTNLKADLGRQVARSKELWEGFVILRRYIDLSKIPEDELIKVIEVYRGRTI